MPESMPRFLLVITAIVAAVAITLGVKDYLDQRHKVNQAATATTPTPAESNATPARKHTSSSKLKRARTSAGAARNTAPANDRETAQAAASETERRLISDGSASSAAKTTAEHATNPITMQGVHNEESAVDGADGARSQLETRKACQPLPNVTKPGDVDEPYYKNWAREYSCLM